MDGNPFLKKSKKDAIDNILNKLGGGGVEILVFNSSTVKDIEKLVALAEQPDRTVDVTHLTELLSDPEAKARHMARMTEQSLKTADGYILVYSVEVGHPGGKARHLSVSKDDTLPSPAVTWVLARLFGFWGGLDDVDAAYPETFNQGKAINLIQFWEPGQ